jgi:chromatin remodeling complex protein RSC6
MAQTKKNSAKKTSSTKKVEPVVAPVVAPVVETQVVDSPVEPVEPEENYDAEFNEVKETLKSALELIKTLSSSVNTLEKRVARDRKVMNKKMKGRVKRVVDPNKPPSGFAKPGPVSAELSKFLKLGKDDLIARTEVTKRITKYCQEHDLQKKEDKRTIHPDKTLRDLLRLKKGDELTFFNLQKYMKVHYPNKDGVYLHA